MADRADVCIVGGGLVGLATALAVITEQPQARICLLDKEPGWARHQSGHNSGVIHSGLYYSPGSLKASLTRRGLRLMYEFCRTHDVPVDQCGKVVVATEPAELPRLNALYTRGRANGVEVSVLSPGELSHREPNVAGVGGLFVADTGIVDFGQVAQRFAELLRERGVELRPGVAARRIVSHSDGTRVETDAGTIIARYTVAAAGLHSDSLIRASGGTPPAKIVPFRGEYYDLSADSRSLVRNLVYPVPDPAFPFLGVHVTRSIDGTVHAGPNAVLALSREGYRRRDISLKTVSELVTDPGVRTLVRTYWRSGAAEIARSVLKPLFVQAVQRLIPDVRPQDLHPAPAGVRAQAVNRRGELVDDFLFHRDGNCLHVVNAPSPAATASLAIGQEIADRLLARLG